MGQIKRNQDISSLEVEELLSRHAGETAATVLEEEDQLRILQNNKKLLIELVADKIIYTDIIKEDVKNKILQRLGKDEEFWHSVEAMKYLTPGEQCLVAETMNDDNYCGKLNKYIRDNVTKQTINSKAYDI